MTAVIAFLLTHTSLLIAALGAVGTVIGIGWGNLRGAKLEREKQAAEETKARDIADQVDNDIGALPADAARKELGTWRAR